MKVKLRLAILYLLVVLKKDFMEDVISENWWDKVWTTLYVGLSTYWPFYHQLSWNILSFLTKLFKETKSPIFPLIKIIYRHINVPLISNTAEFMLFDKLKKNTVFVAGSLPLVRGPGEPYRSFWKFYLKDLSFDSRTLFDRIITSCPMAISVDKLCFKF